MDDRISQPGFRDMGINGPLTSESDTRETLRHAAKYRDKMGLKDYFIVDLDTHHVETSSWNEIIDFVEDPILKEEALSFKRKPDSRLGTVLYHANGGMFSQSVSGRIPHSNLSPGEPRDDKTVHPDVVPLRRAMDSFGIDRMIMFPNALLQIGTHPNIKIETNLAFAYAKFLTEVVLPGDPRLKTMALLPFSDPDACERMIEMYGDHPSVIGFSITSVRYAPVHDNKYMRVYKMLEERGLPLSFHAGFNWQDGYLRQLDKFITMHAISFVLCNMVHMANWVMHGMCERFPKLPVVWIESGLAYLPFMMQRLDNEYLMRQSEAPLLKKLPSEYIRDMYHCCQPMERTNMKLLEATFEAIDAENKLLFSSDWPHWDFDAPSIITDLPFVSEQGKRNILGETARRIYKKL
jgi:predicted TIM-barrel fold metal-dependent hydrolase